MLKEDLEQIAELIKGNVNERFETWKSGVIDNVIHKMSPETKEKFKEIEERDKESRSELLTAICELKESNSKEHRGIADRQDHTNGNVTDLKEKEIENKAVNKTWRTAIGVAFTACLAISGFIGTFYFMERGQQIELVKTVIETKAELASVKEQLNNLKLTE